MEYCEHHFASSYTQGHEQCERQRALLKWREFGILTREMLQEAPPSEYTVKLFAGN